MPPTAADYQMGVGTVLLGAGTSYDITRAPKGWGLPPVRTSDVPRPRDHGLFFGQDFLAGRTLTFEIAVLGDDAADAGLKVDALAAVWQPPAGDAVVPLSVKIPGQVERLLNGRPRRLAWILDDLKAATPTAVLQYEVADPRWYAALLTTLSTPAATSGGGRTYNRVYPLVYAAGGAGGFIAAVNAGDYPTRPVITITGPSTTPRLEHVESGRYLQLDLTLAAAEFIIIDTDARTILLGGTASRFDKLSGTWFELAPGTNTIRFTSADSQGTAQVVYRSAWL